MCIIYVLKANVEKYTILKKKPQNQLSKNFILATANKPTNMKMIYHQFCIWS